MNHFEPRISEDCRTTVEDADSTDEEQYIQMPKIELMWDLAAQDPDLVGRYFRAVKLLSAMVDSVHGFYTFVPALIATSVDADVLLELPTQVKTKYVNSSVYDGNLYITDIGTGGPHASGVHELNFQAGMWNYALNRTFDITTDGIFRSEDNRKGSAPDLVIAQRSTGDDSPPERLSKLQALI
jgi:hypothetical protein